MDHGKYFNFIVTIVVDKWLPSCFVKKSVGIIKKFYLFDISYTHDDLSRKLRFWPWQILYFGPCKIYFFVAWVFTGWNMVNSLPWYKFFAHSKKMEHAIFVTMAKKCVTWKFCFTSHGKLFFITANFYFGHGIFLLPWLYIWTMANLHFVLWLCDHGDYILEHGHLSFWNMANLSHTSWKFYFIYHGKFLFIIMANLTIVVLLYVASQS